VALTEHPPFDLWYPARDQPLPVSGFPDRAGAVRISKVQYPMNDEARVWIRKRRLKSGRTTYHLRWIYPQSRSWKSLKVGRDSKRAEREAAKLEEQLRSGTYRDTRRISWDEFQDEHVGMIRGAVNRAESERTLRDFGIICRPLGPQSVTYSMVEAYVRHLVEKGNSTATRNKRLRYLRAAFNKAIRRGYIVRSPMDGWEWEKEEDRVPRALTADEKPKLLDACPTTQWRTFVYLALTTGCRRNELLKLAWDRVDYDNAWLLITGTKSHRDRLQPLPNEAIPMLREVQAQTMRDGGPFVSLGAPSQVCHRFRQIVEAAGIAHCTIHDLRRTFCTDLARLGVNQVVAQRLAGHASSSTTARYYQHVDDGMKRDAVARLARSAG